LDAINRLTALCKITNWSKQEKFNVIM